MTDAADIADHAAQATARPVDASAQHGSAGRWLLGGTAMLFVAAGGLLWAREGERLFADGLIAAIARCF